MRPLSSPELYPAKGAPCWARTSGLLFVRKALYPTELTGQGDLYGTRTHNPPLDRRTLYPIELTDRS